MSASYTTGTANRLIEDADSCYAYDANGNLASKTEKTGITCNGGVTAYSWDVLNRLVAIDFADGTSAQYRYDAQGRRIEKAVNGALTRYVYDDDAILLEFDGGNVLQARYSHGEEIDQPLAMARGGQSYFYQTDHLGSIRLLTDAAGTVVSRYDYDAFGQLEATSFEGVANPYAFTARERDAESGLMFYRARYYDPKLGRFINEDPIGFDGGDLNLYRYVSNTPLVPIDPSGQLTFASYLSGVAVMGAGGVGYVAGLVWTINIILLSPDISKGSCKAAFLQDAITTASTATAAGLAAAILGGPAAGAGVGATLFAFLAAVVAAVEIHTTSCLSGSEAPK